MCLDDAGNTAMRVHPMNDKNERMTGEVPSAIHPIRPYFAQP
jgi:hypothetical protein